MKDLSIEEKAKRYDEALERMKSWVRGEHPECFTEAQKAAEFIFPELKKSKKEWIEKIRQELKSYLGHRKIEQIAESDAVNQWIVWLEKPVEKKTIIIPKFRVGDEIKTSDEESITITKIDEKGYWSGDLFICDFDEECIWDLVNESHN